MSADRVRPIAHFTPRRGWINDPYGVRWDGSQYHVWYQAVPDQTAWSPACNWGHAVSADLVLWEERGLALVPQPHEAGCWSGCVVDDGTGRPRAFYTRVQSDDLKRGRIAVARCDDSGRFASGPGDVVVDGPPDASRVTVFRDPYVWHEADGWAMVVGAGATDGAGAVLQYRSEDLDRWRYAGVVCAGRVPTGRVPAGDDVTRQVWECPQMVQIDDRWVLVVSTQVDGRAGHVAAAVGGYDGARLHPDGWQRLAWGTAPYATSVFRDRDGRPCMISWLQEEEPRHRFDTRVWAGAESLVAELTVDRAGRVAATPHPAPAASGLFAHHAPVSWPWRQDLGQSTPALATHVTAVADAPVAIAVHRRQRPVVTITRSGANHGLVVDRPGHPVETIPCLNPAGAVDVFIDADILEIFNGGVYGAWRLES